MSITTLPATATSAPATPTTAHVSPTDAQPSSTTHTEKVEEPVITPAKIEALNKTYYETRENLRVESAIRFIEDVRNRKSGFGNSTGAVELYKNLNEGSNAVVLYGVKDSDLTFICRSLSVGGFSTPRTDEKGRTVTAIFDNAVYKAYNEKFPETPIITDFFEQQEIRYQASLKAANEARLAAQINVTQAT